MISFWTLLKRILLVRCPRCGKGKLFRRWFTMYEHCPVCHLIYEREEGFYTGAWAINLIISELLVAAFIVLVAIWAATHPGTPLIPLVIVGAIFSVLLPFLFFRHSRSVWISMNYWLNPPELEQE
jgi:uncharacterized protein (DUF983 family)